MKRYLLLPAVFILVILICTANATQFNETINCDNAKPVIEPTQDPVSEATLEPTTEPIPESTPEQESEPTPGADSEPTPKTPGHSSDP
jgi:hypothetical protein